MSLTKQLFFLSPAYGINEGETYIGGFYENGSSWDAIKRLEDEKDKLPTWLKENCMEFTEDNPEPNHTLRNNGKIMGTNGVYCKLKVQKIKALKKSSPPLDMGYRRVLHIEACPISKGLPPELSTILDELKYQQVANENEYVSEVFYN